MSHPLAQEFRTPLVDDKGQVTQPWQKRFQSVVIDAQGPNPIMDLRLTLPEYASNAAALAGGLVVDQLYRNGDAVCVVH